MFILFNSVALQLFRRETLLLGGDSPPFLYVQESVIVSFIFQVESH